MGAKHPFKETIQQSYGAMMNIKEILTSETPLTNEERKEIYRRKKEDLDVTMGYYNQDDDPQYIEWLEEQSND